MNKNINNPVELIGISKAKLSSLSSLQDIENLVEASIRKNIQQWIENSEVNPPDPTTRCRECGEVANYTSKRDGYVRTQFGLIRYKRARYHCPHCHYSTCPLDERLNPVRSLARMRAKLCAGKNLPVGELAQAWGLGSLEIFPEQKPASAAISRSERSLPAPELETKHSGNNHHQFRPSFANQSRAD